MSNDALARELRDLIAETPPRELANRLAAFVAAAVARERNACAATVDHVAKNQQILRATYAYLLLNGLAEMLRDRGKGGT